MDSSAGDTERARSDEVWVGGRDEVGQKFSLDMGYEYVLRLAIDTHGCLFRLLMTYVHKLCEL